MRSYALLLPFTFVAVGPYSRPWCSADPRGQPVPVGIVSSTATRGKTPLENLGLRKQRAQDEEAAELLGKGFALPHLQLTSGAPAFASEAPETHLGDASRGRGVEEPAPAEDVTQLEEEADSSSDFQVVRDVSATVPLAVMRRGFEPGKHGSASQLRGMAAWKKRRLRGSLPKRKRLRLENTVEGPRGNRASQSRVLSLVFVCSIVVLGGLIGSYALQRHEVRELQPEQDPSIASARAATVARIAVPLAAAVVIIFLILERRKGVGRFVASVGQTTTPEDGKLPGAPHPPSPSQTGQEEEGGMPRAKVAASESTGLRREATQTQPPVGPDGVPSIVVSVPPRGREKMIAQPAIAGDEAGLARKLGQEGVDLIVTGSRYVATFTREATQLWSQAAVPAIQYAAASAQEAAELALRHSIGVADSMVAVLGSLARNASTLGIHIMSWWYGLSGAVVSAIISTAAAILSDPVRAAGGAYEDSDSRSGVKPFESMLTEAVRSLGTLDLWGLLWSLGEVGGNLLALVVVCITAVLSSVYSWFGPLVADPFPAGAPSDTPDVLELAILSLAGVAVLAVLAGVLSPASGWFKSMREMVSKNLRNFRRLRKGKERAHGKESLASRPQTRSPRAANTGSG